MVRGVWNKVWESIVFEGKVFVFYSKWTGETLEGFKYVLFINLFIQLFIFDCAGSLSLHKLL